MSDTFTRLDKASGERTTVTRRDVLGHMIGNYRDDHLALDAATEEAPVRTPFASYWPTVATKRTAGQAIARAIGLFNRGPFTEAELATAIDDALRSYR